MLSLILLGVSVVAGFLGSILGLGGGAIVVPVLTLFFNIDIRYAIAASLVSIIATSSGAAASFLKDHLTNLRLAVLLEAGTVSGAIVGFYISSMIDSKSLIVFYGFFLLFSAVMMLRRREEGEALPNHPWAEKLRLAGTHINSKGESVPYTVAHVPMGLVVMVVAGVFSALLGIGSGIFKVLAMDGSMRIPIKISSATSNFMIGVTASASASAYLMRGDIRPEIAAPVALGIIVGSYIGGKTMPKMNAVTIRKIFVVVLFIVAAQMLVKGFK